MKRLISLVLAIAMLLSLAPAVFAEETQTTAGAALEFGTPKEQTATEYNTNNSVTYYEIPVIFKNNTEQDIQLSMFECHINYDKLGLEPVNVQVAELDWLGVASYEGYVAKWTPEQNASDGLAIVTATTNNANYHKTVKNHETFTLFKLNLRRVANVENGDYQLKFAEPYYKNDKPVCNLAGFDYENESSDYSQSANTLDCSATATITVTDGVAPTLESVSIEPSNKSAVYGAAETFKLKALSTNGADITGLVGWTVPTDLWYSADNLTVSTTASTPANTYTITGKYGEVEKTVDLFVDKAKLDSVSLTLTGYEKGQLVSAATVTGDYCTVPEGGYKWNDDVPAGNNRFEASTPYKLSVAFKLDSNYLLDAGSTVNLHVGDETVTSTVSLGNDCFIADFQLPATGNKDSVTINTLPTASEATYGDTLRSVTLTGGVASVEGKFAWTNGNQSVENAGNNSFEVTFTPDDETTYANATANVTVKVNPKSIEANDVTIEEIPSQSYTGLELQPTPTIKFKDETLALSTDFSTEYENNKECGTATVKIHGNGNYTGTATKTFQITKSISSCEISLRPADDRGYTYNGQAKEPTVTVKDGNKELTKDADYTVDYSNNTDAGTATVTVTGQGSYTGSVEKQFTIEPQHLSINTSDITINETFTYDGTEKRPTVETLIVGDKTPVTLTLGTDYTVEYSNNIDAGSEAEITFKPIEGSNYTFGEFTKTFTIGKATLTDVAKTKTMNIRYGATAAQTFSDWGLPADVAFTAELGKVEDEQKILSNVTLLGTQLTFRLKETTSTDVTKTASIPVTFSSTNYENVTITLTITVVKKDDAGLNVLGTATKLTYGKEINLDYSVTNPGTNGKLTATVTGGGDVTVDIENKKLTATRVGDVKISFTYESDETIGTDSISFTVVPNEITVTADNQTREYGEANPTFTYKITSGRLELNDELNIEAETDANVTSPVGDNYKITLTSKMGSNYAVTLEPGTLTITKAPLTIESATVKDKEYDGNKTATVTEVEFNGLKNGEALTSTDYTVTGEFKDANAGAEKEVGVTVTLNTTGTAANYELKSNTLDAKGTIEKRTTQVRFTEIKNAVYTGKPYARENYAVNSENAVFKFYKADGNSRGEEISAPTDVGKYYITAIVEETANEKLSAVTEGFEITAKSLADDDITVEAIPDQTYTGEQLTPAVTIKYNGMTLTADKDYTVAYENCTNVGVATAKITGKGNYEGTTTKTFNITAKPVTNAQVIVNDTGLVYDKTAKQPTVIVKIGDTEVPPADYDVAYSNNVNAGTATATVTFKGNYTGTAAGTFPIAPKTVGLTWEGSEFLYDKTEKTVTATAAGVETGDTVTVTVKGGKQTEIGTYIATAAKLDNPNYKLLETGLSHNFTIKNAIETISVVSPVTVSAAVDGLSIRLVGTKKDTEPVKLKINGEETTPVNGKLSVRGIDYTVDDSGVVKTPNDVKLAEIPAAVPDAPANASADTKLAVAAIQGPDGAKSEGLAAAAAAAVTKEAAKKNTSAENKEVKADVKLEIEVKDYEKNTADNKSVLTLEVTPKVTYTYKDESGKEKTETKTIDNSDIKAPVIISVKLPEGMPMENLFVKHGKEYIRPTVDETNRTITWQQSSFSPVVIMSDARAVKIVLVKDNGEKITMDLDLSGIGTALPKDGNKTNWKFDGIDGSYSSITEALFDKLAKKGGTVTAASVSGSSSDPEPSKPSKPGNSSSGLLLPGLGDDELIFRDVGKYDYYYNAVKWALKKDITSGTGRYTFSPDAACTRAQTVTFLWRAAGSPRPVSTVNPFTDVHYGDYFYQAVLWAVENGITMGTSATTFSPDATVTRAQVVTFLWRANGQPAAWNSGFTDVSADAYYAKAVAWAVQNSITTGTGFGVFSPDAACTRAQIVTFLYRYLG